MSWHKKALTMSWHSTLRFYGMDLIGICLMGGSDQAGKGFHERRKAGPDIGIIDKTLLLTTWSIGGIFACQGTIFIFSCGCLKHQFRPIASFPSSNCR